MYIARLMAFPNLQHQIGRLSSVIHVLQWRFLVAQQGRKFIHVFHHTTVQQGILFQHVPCFLYCLYKTHHKTETVLAMDAKVAVDLTSYILLHHEKRPP